MKGLVLLFSILLPAPLLAQDTARTDAGAGRTTGYQRECRQRYDSNNCAQFFRENPTVAEYAINCNDPIDPVKELAQCGSGIARAGTDIKDFIKAIYGGLTSGPSPEAVAAREQRVRYATECVKVEECKINAYIAAAGREPNQHMREFLKRMTSPAEFEGVMYQASNIRMRDNHQRAVQILRTEPDSPERDQKLEQMFPGWTERKQAKAQSLWELGRNAASHLVKVDACYSREVQMEMVCHGLTSLIAPGAAINAGSKLYRVANALRTSRAATAAVNIERAGLAARALAVLGRPLSKIELNALERAHLVGRAEGATLGNYTPAQLKEKLRILQSEGGIPPHEASQLVRRGVAGDGKFTSEFDRLVSLEHHYASDPSKILDIQTIQARLLKCLVPSPPPGCDDIIREARAIRPPYEVARPNTSIPQDVDDATALVDVSALNRSTRMMVTDLQNRNISAGSLRTLMRRMGAAHVRTNGSHETWVLGNRTMTFAHHSGRSLHDYQIDNAIEFLRIPRLRPN